MTGLAVVGTTYAMDHMPVGVWHRTRDARTPAAAWPARLWVRESVIVGVAFGSRRGGCRGRRPCNTARPETSTYLLRRAVRLATSTDAGGARGTRCRDGARAGGGPHLRRAATRAARRRQPRGPAPPRRRR